MVELDRCVELVQPVILDTIRDNEAQWPELWALPQAKKPSTFLSRGAATRG